MYNTNQELIKGKCRELITLILDLLSPTLVDWVKKKTKESIYDG